MPDLQNIRNNTSSLLWNKLPWHYSWLILAATFLTLFAASGIRITPSVLMVPFETSFGWSRNTISLALTISVLLSGIFGPFAAAVMELYSVRRIMSLALLCMFLGAVFSIHMDSAWQLIVLWGIVIGTGTGLLSSALGNIIAHRWFVKHRGIAIGLLSSGSTAGQLVFLPLFAKILEYYPWQAVFYSIGAVILFILLFVILVMRNTPTDMGILPYGASTPVSEQKPPEKNAVALAINGLKRIVRLKEFWLLGCSYFVCGATTIGLIGTHFIPACIEHGYSEFTAAGMLAIAGMLNIVGTTLSGWLSDRFNNCYLLVFYYSFRGLALFLLPFQLNPATREIFLFIIIYGLDWLATVPPTIRLSAKLFGHNHVIAFGWISVIHQMGAAFLTLYGSILHTWFGSYQWPFISGAVLCLIAAGLVMQLRHAA